MTLLQNAKIPLAIIIGILSAFLLRDFHYGSNWVIIFSLLTLGHVLYSGITFQKSNMFKLAIFMTSLLAVLLYGKGWSVFLISVSYLALVSETNPLFSDYLTDVFKGANTALRGWKQYFERKSLNNPSKISFQNRFYYIVIPFFILLIFTAFYATGSTYLAAFLGDFFETIGTWIENIFGGIDMEWVFLFFLGILFLNAAIHKRSSAFVSKVRDFPVALQKPLRKNKKAKKAKPRILHNSMISLLVEYKLACLVLLLLNGMLLLTNGLDIANLWIGFDPAGVHMSNFVHEGTYVLIFSIILASLVLLFYYRGNLNFIRNNEFLLILAKIWVIQNMFLALSVAVRNFHYINSTHALTEKRIGVFVFLVLVLIGLSTLFLKIINKKTIAWVVKLNFATLMLVVSLVQIVNWERLIISYNFSNPEIENIDMESLFEEIDYDLVFLDECIGRSEERLNYYSYRTELDAYEKWNEVKYNYHEKYSEGSGRSWSLYKSENLEDLRFYEVDYLEGKVYH